MQWDSEGRLRLLGELRLPPSELLATEAGQSGPEGGPVSPICGGVQRKERGTQAGLNGSHPSQTPGASFAPLLAPSRASKGEGSLALENQRKIVMFLFSDMKHRGPEGSMTCPR